MIRRILHAESYPARSYAAAGTHRRGGGEALLFPASIDDVLDGLTEEKTASFVNMLAEIGHESPIEHASFTFGIEGVSRSLLAQITRHRIASFSVQSQRYVKEGHFEFVLPPEIEAIPEAREEYLRAMEEDQAHYERLTALLKEKHLAAFLAGGMEEKAAARAAEKKAIEDARFVLRTPAPPNDRYHERPQSAELFRSSLLQPGAVGDSGVGGTDARPLSGRPRPRFSASVYPPCTRGACPEGKMSCGKAAEIRARYQKK